MEISEQLTNEKISKKFANQFQLCNYAISMAEEMIKSGRDPRIKTMTDNPALIVYDEILEGKDRFQDVEFEKLEVNKEVLFETVEETKETLKASKE